MSKQIFFTLFAHWINENKTERCFHRDEGTVCRSGDRSELFPKGVDFWLKGRAPTRAGLYFSSHFIAARGVFHLMCG